MAAKNSLKAEFYPTDEELILKYLRRKINGESLPDDVVLECDLFGEDNPWEIWESFKDKSSNNGKDLYFFTRLKKKFVHNNRSNRAVRTIGCGSWEGEDAPKSIMANYEGKIQCIGSKKRYRFEKSRTEQDGRWIVHEFSLHSSLIKNESGSNYVLCRFRKNDRIVQQKTARKRKEQVETGQKSMVLGLQATSLTNDDNSNIDNNVMLERNTQKKTTVENSKVQAEIGETKTKVIKSSIEIKFAMYNNTEEAEVEDDKNTPWAEEFAEELLSTIEEDHMVVEENVCMLSNTFFKDLMEDNLI